MPGSCLRALLLLLFWTSVAAAEDEDAPSLREQLTEREDELRLEEPWTVEVAGRPLILGGEMELSLDAIDREAFGDDSEDGGSRRWLEPEVEAEAFYSFGPPLSLFAQLKLASEIPLHAGDRRTGPFIERGEMWVHSANLGGSGIDLEFGRLDFEDDRLWWWDGDLDALRLLRETEHAEIALAVAKELAPQRSDLGYIEPEHEDVHRLILEASWDWRPGHTVQGFALRHRDRSTGATTGQVVRSERADDSDADLVWTGLRAAGAWDAGRRGLFGYWLDLARVQGDERLAEFEAVSEQDSEVVDLRWQRVRGWAFDVGATWVMPTPRQPRLSIGYARGSGDADVEDEHDRSFRQTGLQGNEVAFGGVQRFDHYGLLLDPELSNLSVLTLDLGCSLLDSSSIDLVYNRYRLLKAGGGLRESRLDLQLSDGQHALGQALDLILAIEEGPRYELELQASAFLPGAALGEDRGDWLYGALIAFRMAF